MLIANTPERLRELVNEAINDYGFEMLVGHIAGILKETGEFHGMDKSKKHQEFSACCLGGCKKLGKTLVAMKMLDDFTRNPDGTIGTRVKNI